MEYKWSNECGDFHVIHEMVDGEGIRITNKYFKSLVEDIAVNSYQQINNTVWIPPFAYRERQVHTLIAPSINKNSDYFLMESPVNRNWNGIDSKLDDKHGWVDYWSSHKTYDYYFEVKHGFFSYKSMKVRAEELEKWNEACFQLETLIDEVEIQKDYCKGIFKVAFHVMPVYISSTNFEKLQETRIDSEGVLESTINQMSLENEVNWACIWRLADDIDNTYEYSNTNERYPCVMFIAKVYDIEK